MADDGKATKQDSEKEEKKHKRYYNSRTNPNAAKYIAKKDDRLTEKVWPLTPRERYILETELLPSKYRDYRGRATNFRKRATRKVPETNSAVKVIAKHYAQQYTNMVDNPPVTWAERSLKKKEGKALLKEALEIAERHRKDFNAKKPALRPRMQELQGVFRSQLESDKPRIIHAPTITRKRTVTSRRENANKKRKH